MWERSTYRILKKGGCSSLLAIYFPRHLYALFCLKAYSLKVKQHQSSLLTLFYWNQKMKLPETFNLVLASISQQNSQNKVKKSRGSCLQETTRQSAGSDVCFYQNPWNVLNKPQVLLHSNPLFRLIQFLLPNSTAGNKLSPTPPGALGASSLTSGSLAGKSILHCKLALHCICDRIPQKAIFVCSVVKEFYT